MQGTRSALEMKLGWLSPDGTKSRKTYADFSVSAQFPCASPTSELSPPSSQACVTQRWWRAWRSPAQSIWHRPQEPRQVPEQPAECPSSDLARAILPLWAHSGLHDDRRVLIIPQEFVWLKCFLFFCVVCILTGIMKRVLIVSSLQLYNNEVVHLNLKPAIVYAAHELTNKLSWVRWL